jgi:hypothetical protein
VALAVLAGSAHAELCQRVCARYDYHGGCAEYKEQCTGDSSSRSTPSPDYGAIAYGRTKQAYGASYRWGNRAKAEGNALQRCRKYGDDCEVMVWFMNKCGAVAVRVDTKVGYWGLGNSEDEARSVARQECAKDHGQRCEVLVSQCASK